MTGTLNTWVEAIMLLKNSGANIKTIETDEKTLDHLCFLIEKWWLADREPKEVKPYGDVTIGGVTVTAKRNNVTRA